MADLPEHDQDPADHPVSPHGVTASFRPSALMTRRLRLVRTALPLLLCAAPIAHARTAGGTVAVAVSLRPSVMGRSSLTVLRSGGLLAYESPSPAPADSPSSGPPIRAELIARMERAGRVAAEGPWGAAILVKPRFGATGVEYSEATALGDRAGPSALPHPIPMQQLSKLQIRVGSTRKGAIIGVLTATVPTLLLGILVAGVEGGMGGLPGAVAIVGTLGAGVGGYIGTFVPRWQTVYVGRSSR